MFTDRRRSEQTEEDEEEDEDEERKDGEEWKAKMEAQEQLFQRAKAQTETQRKRA